MNNPIHNKDNNLLGIGLMTAGIFLISIKDAGSKFLVAGYHPIQIMALSAWLSIIILLLWPYVTGKRSTIGLDTFRSKYWKQHAIRSIIGVFAGIFFLYSLKYLKFVDVTVIFFSAPIFMTAMSALVLKEKVGPIRWAAVVIGFIGVVIAMQPDFGNLDSIESFDWTYALPVGAAVAYAIRMIMVRNLAGLESARQIVFFTRLGVAVIVTIPMFFFWEPMIINDVYLLIGFTVIQLIAHILITQSTVSASLSLVGPIEYTALLWNVIMGYMFWNETPTSNIWIGSFFIISAGLVVAYREARLKKPLNDPNPS